MIYVSDTTRIRFRHVITNANKDIAAVVSPFGTVKGFTECFIQLKRNGEDWKTWEYGAAVCSQEDNFDRATGRKIALARALKNIEPKSLRKDFWEAYFRKVKR